MAKAEFPILEKCYDLVLWLHGRTQRFPRTLRGGIGLRIENQVMELYETLGAATTSKQRLDLLQSGSTQLDTRLL